MTLSKYIATSRSCRRALASNRHQARIADPCAQAPYDQPVLVPYRKTSVACIVIIGYLLMIAPKFSGCLAVPSGLTPLAYGLLRGF